VKPTQLTLCITEPLQQALRQAAANELSSASDYGRRALVKVMCAEGCHNPGRRPWRRAGCSAEHPPEKEAAVGGRQ
jgi:hypothetical protein